MEMQFRIGNDVKCRLKLVPEGSPEPPTPPEPPGPPEPDWDKYENAHSDEITVVLLDSLGNETDNVQYFSRLDYALNYLSQQYSANRDNLFNFYYGDDAPVPSSSYWDAWFKLYFFNGMSENKNNIKMFRYPRVWVTNGSIYDLSGFNEYSGGYMTRLKQVALPETLANGSDISVPSSFIAHSGVDLVKFRSQTINQVLSNAFGYCSDLKSIELPRMNGQYAIDSRAFSGCDGIKITLNNAAGSINDEPWGATNATVIWKG